MPELCQNTLKPTTKSTCCSGAPCSERGRASFLHHQQLRHQSNCKTSGVFNTISDQIHSGSPGRAPCCQDHALLLHLFRLLFFSFFLRLLLASSSLPPPALGPGGSSSAGSHEAPGRPGSRGRTSARSTASRRRGGYGDNSRHMETPENLVQEELGSTAFD